MVLPVLGPSVATLTSGIGWGIGSGLVLFLIGAVLWMRIVLGMAPGWGRLR